MPGVPYIKPSETREFGSLNGKARGEYYVYIVSDERGRLLYIGTTNDLFTRFAQHRTKANWYGDMAHVKVEVFHRQDDARRWEYYLIGRFNPPHNIKGVHHKTAEHIRWARQHAEWRQRRVPSERVPYGR